MALAGVGVLAYFVLVGDLGCRDPHPGFRITSGLLASGLVIAYVLRVPRYGDEVDRRLLAGWTAFADPWTTTELLKVAHDRWLRSEPSPQPLRSQPLLISIMLGLSDNDIDAADSSMSASFCEMYVAVSRCDRAANEALERAPATLKRRAGPWELAIRQAEAAGVDSSGYRRLHRLMTSEDLYAGAVAPYLNPLNEHGVRGSSTDTFGYRRWPIEWPWST